MYSMVVAAAIHEIGDALGLNDTEDADSLMFPTVQEGRRELSAADVEAIQSLYGPAP